MYRLSKRRIREFEPVSIDLPKIGVVEICRLDDAVITLVGRWPVAVANSSKRLAALSLCRDAFEGRAWPDVARTAFIAAAEEAGLLHGHSEPEP